MEAQCILADIVGRQAKRYGSRQAITFVEETGKTLAAYSYEQFKQAVDDVACAFETLGLEAGQRVVIFSSNRPEMLITDFACYHLGAVPVSVYSTSSAEQLLYVLRDCQPQMVLAGGKEQLAKALECAAKCDWSPRVISFDNLEGAMPWADVLALGEKSSDECRKEVEKRRLAVKPDDIATLIYTSGTTGEPKAAVLPHSCFNAAIEIHEQRLTMLSDKDRSLCFLPLCHIFEKAWSYFCLSQGISIAINRDAREIAGTIAHVRPTVMCSVPRFWEKVYAGVNEKIAHMNPVSRTVAKAAVKIGHKRNIDYVRLGKKAPWWLEKLYQTADKKVFSMVKRTVGIENGNIFPTAGAPISANIAEFFRSIGVPMVVGYGLSETTATVTCFPDVDYVIGSVGTVMPRVQVRIGAAGEIEVKGPTVMRGYYNKPAATAEVFTSDGWLRTGDAGYFDEQGALVLTERLKDLFKTSNGKYVAPQAIESRLGEDKFIEQVAVIGDSRKYVTAIIIPAFSALKEYARRKKIAFKNLEDLINNSDIKKMLEERIEKLQAGLPSFEQIKKFTLLPKAFTIESGELTNTLKIRRPVIAKHYAKEIEAMYPA